MAIEIELAFAVQKSKYFTRKDEAYGLLFFIMSPKLLFHVESCATPNLDWTAFDTLSGKKDEMQGHILENELNLLDLRSFENILYFYTKFKALLLHHKNYGIDKSKRRKINTYNFFQNWVQNILFLSFLFTKSGLQHEQLGRCPHSILLLSL